LGVRAPEDIRMSYLAIPGSWYKHTVTSAVASFIWPVAINGDTDIAWEWVINLIFDTSSDLLFIRPNSINTNMRRVDIFSDDGGAATVAAANDSAIGVSRNAGKASIIRGVYWTARGGGGRGGIFTNMEAKTGAALVDVNFKNHWNEDTTLITSFQFIMGGAALIGANSTFMGRPMFTG
jgi:hypothetical protein